MSQDGGDSEMVRVARQSREENNINRIMQEEKDKTCSRDSDQMSLAGV